MLSLIKDYDLPYKFPKEVVKEAQKYGDKINLEEAKIEWILEENIIFSQ